MQGYFDPGTLTFDDQHRLLAANASADGIVFVGAFDCGSDLIWSRFWDGLPDARMVAAPVPGGSDLIVAGSTATRMMVCGPVATIGWSRCGDCFAPHPFLFRVTRQGSPAPGFSAHH